jgi:beta-glucosidase
MKSNPYADYVSEKVTPLYWFGHGLSYTKFEYSDLSIDQDQAKAGEVVNISLKVRNVGAVAGDEVVQLYIRDEFASLPRPVKELKGYARISLKPGEEQSLAFHLPVDQLAFYDEDFKLCVENGRILVMVGSSSDDIRLRGEFEITGAKKTFVKDRVFVCPVSSQ